MGVVDKNLVLGAGAFEVMCHAALMQYRDSLQGRKKLGVQAFADALLVIPKTLAENAGYDCQETVIGFNIEDGEPMDPAVEGIWDNYRVKHQMLDSAAIISAQLLLVDEVIRAGKQMKKG